MGPREIILLGLELSSISLSLSLVLIFVLRITTISKGLAGFFGCMAAGTSVRIFRDLTAMGNLDPTKIFTYTTLIHPMLIVGLPIFGMTYLLWILFPGRDDIKESGGMFLGIEGAIVMAAIGGIMFVFGLGLHAFRMGGL